MGMAVFKEGWYFKEGSTLRVSQGGEGHITIKSMPNENPFFD